MLIIKPAALNRLGSPPISKTISTQRRKYAAPGPPSIPHNKTKYVPSSGTYPKGFLVGSACAGVKPSNHDRNDLALVVSEVPTSAAAVFTKNRFEAAPVTTSSQTLRDRAGQGIRGVVVNVWCANAVTGKNGLEDAKHMCEQTDAVLDKVKKTDGKGLTTLVMSTGVVGQR